MFTLPTRAVYIFVVGSGYECISWSSHGFSLPHGAASTDDEALS